jgi:hypothetical protein
MALNVEPQPPKYPGGISARLCNFVTNQIPAVLLDDHRAWLNTNVVEPLKQGKASYAELLGMASRKGNAGRNQFLSDARCAAVKQHIEQKVGSSLSAVVPIGEGDRLSGGGRNDDDGFYRAVQVNVQLGPKPQDPDGLQDVTIWINAFIHREVRDAKGGLQTITLVRGIHAGKTALPGPTPFLPDCFLTDNRDFDDNLSAKSRIHGQIRISFVGSQPKVVDQPTPVCSPTTRIRISDGVVLNESIGVVKGGYVPDPTTFTVGSTQVRLNVNMAANNPEARTWPPGFPSLGIPRSWDIPVPNFLDPDIDIEGVAIVDSVARTVEFKGKVDRFPFFEMYASTDEGKTATRVFTLAPHPGDNPWNLPGGANRDVASELGKPAVAKL